MIKPKTSRALIIFSKCWKKICTKFSTESCFLDTVEKHFVQLVKENVFVQKQNMVKIDGHDIQSLVEIPLDELLPLMKNLKLNQHDAEIAKRLTYEINTRLEFLNKVGLG